MKKSWKLKRNVFLTARETQDKDNQILISLPDLKTIWDSDWFSGQVLGYPFPGKRNLTLTYLLMTRPPNHRQLKRSLEVIST